MSKHLKGQGGGSWDRQTHEHLYGANLNSGLGDFIVEHIKPRDFLEFGAGLCGLATYIGHRMELRKSYCLEPDVSPAEVSPNISLLNFDVLSEQPPRLLDQYFDLILSIEVAEHVPREKHEALFDFLVARAGRMIVFSAARPGQGGHGHIAERPEMEWRHEFIERGCRFDPVLTMLARNMCNSRNINHRRNVQVFHAPDRSLEILDLERKARPYLQDLLTIVMRHGGRFTGNLFYVDFQGACAGRPEHSLHWKRENLRQLAARASNILEIGFMAGHSALLFLLANSDSKLTIVDPLEFSHSQECFDYLLSAFPGRLELIPGYSTDVLPNMPARCFDLVHLDGGKDKTITSDLDLIKPLVAHDHVLCIDDTQNVALNGEVTRRIHLGEIEVGGFESMIAASRMSRYTHCIARYSSESLNLNDGVWSRMRNLYRDVAHPSIYTSEGQAGRGRAEYLIKALRAIESCSLTGAFVEVGVAAGHSSVIAALTASRYFPRDFFLYDTFSGFQDPLPDEKDYKGKSIHDYDLDKYAQEPCTAPAVRRQLEAAGVLSENLFLVEGLAEEMIPLIKPPRIAILRIDADLFNPTYAALREMYDLVEPGGYIIVDDYGHWKGCAKAVDLFFSERDLPFPGNKIDYTCYGWRR